LESLSNFDQTRCFAHTLAHTNIAPLNRRKTHLLIASSPGHPWRAPANHWVDHNISFRRCDPGIRPIGDNTLNAALRRLGCDKIELTVHGLRLTTSVELNESGKWHADAIERQLAHQDPIEVRLSSCCRILEEGCG
jgi:integrase